MLPPQFAIPSRKWPLRVKNSLSSVTGTPVYPYYYFRVTTQQCISQYSHVFLHQPKTLFALSYCYFFASQSLLEYYTINLLFVNKIILSIIYKLCGSFSWNIGTFNTTNNSWKFINFLIVIQKLNFSKSLVFMLWFWN